MATSRSLELRSREDQWLRSGSFVELTKVAAIEFEEQQKCTLEYDRWERGSARAAKPAKPYRHPPWPERPLSTAILSVS